MFKLKTMNPIFLLSLIIFFLFAFSCTNEFRNNDTKNDLREEKKDTINVTDLIEDLKKPEHDLTISFFDTNGFPVTKLIKEDTLYILVKYVSNTFGNLFENHSIELESACDNLTFVSKQDNGKYKLVIGAHSDSIQFDVFLKSEKYIFNDYYVNNGVVQYYLTDIVSLCRISRVVGGKSQSKIE